MLIFKKYNKTKSFTIRLTTEKDMYIYVYMHIEDIFIYKYVHMYIKDK